MKLFWEALEDRVTSSAEATTGGNGGDSYGGGVFAAGDAGAVVQITGSTVESNLAQGRDGVDGSNDNARDGAAGGGGGLAGGGGLFLVDFDSITINPVRHRKQPRP